jgi:hypothetical protein
MHLMTQAKFNVNLCCLEWPPGLKMLLKQQQITQHHCNLIPVVQVLFGSYPIAHCRSPYTVVQFLAERCWPPLQFALRLGNEGLSCRAPGDEAAHGTCIEKQQQKEKEASSGKGQAVEEQACLIQGQAKPAADEGEVLVWTAMSLCENLAKKRQWCNRRGGRLDTYKAANWILRAALAGEKGIGLCFLPPPAGRDVVDSEP